MTEISDQDEAVELLQQLGLKEYEAKSFVALSRLERGTAKDISDISDVPRTRVYDAVRVLETKGLVEIQHSNPQLFRSVSTDEAVETLQREYEQRTESLRGTLRELGPETVDEDVDVAHEVWSLSGEAAITTRTRQLVDEADSEVVIVVGHEDAFTTALTESLESARRRGVTVVVGAVSEDLAEVIGTALPGTEVFVSGIEWLDQSSLTGDETEISRLLLVDRGAILVSSFNEAPGGEHTHEQAVFGRGFDNGLVAIVRRILSTGLLPATDPASGSD